MVWNPIEAAKRLEHSVATGLHTAEQKVVNAEHAVVNDIKKVGHGISNVEHEIVKDTKVVGHALSEIPHEIKHVATVAKDDVVKAAHATSQYVSAHGGIGSVLESASKAIGGDIANLIKPTSSALTGPIIGIAFIAAVGLYFFLEIK